MKMAPSPVKYHAKSEQIPTGCKTAVSTYTSGLIMSVQFKLTQKRVKSRAVKSRACLKVAGCRGMLALGQVVNEKYLACGSFGRIYNATVRFPWCDVQVAIKKIPVVDTACPSTMKEAEILRRLSHPNIVTTYDIIINKVEREMWIVMECLNGGSLRQYCTGDRCLEFCDKLKVSCDCWSALCYLHEEAKITHKDIKPENILLHHYSNNQVIAKLCDFGLAKMSDSLTKTEVSSVTGTAMYFPPEYVDAIRNPEKADVYSMGASLWELYSQCYFWCQDGTNVPLTYPQIIGKLLGIWKQLKKGVVSTSHRPPLFPKSSCPTKTRTSQLLTMPVQFDRHCRPTANEIKENFSELWKIQKIKITDVCEKGSNADSESISVKWTEQEEYCNINIPKDLNCAKLQFQSKKMQVKRV